MDQVDIAARRDDWDGDVRSCIGVHKATMIVVVVEVRTTMERISGSPGVGVVETMAGEYKKTMVETRRSPGASAPVAMGARVS